MTDQPQLAAPLNRSSGSAVVIARASRMIAVIGCAALLVACASSGSPRSQPARPGAAPAWEVDGPGQSLPADLASVPDAEPTVEPLRSGAMRPYEVMGRSYTPITEDVPHTEWGLASWYGRKFHGRATASGERYDMYAMSAAHPTLPLPSFVRVRNPANQREVIVRVNDRGPFHPGRIIDLSYTAAFKLDLLRGVAPVEIERITNSEIQAGSWRRDSQRPAVVVAVSSEPTRRTRQSALARIDEPRPERATAYRAEPAPEVAVRAAAVATPLPVAAPAAFAVTQLPTSDAAQRQRTAPSEFDGFWVQLGAFRFRDGAENFQRQVVADLSWIAPALSVRSDAELHRLQAGPYADRDQAAGVAQRLRDSLQLVPVIVERR